MALDIRRYFPSVDHAILLEAILFRRVADPRTRSLLTMLVEAGAAVYRTPLAIEVLGLAAAPLPPGTGLPIGSSLSQWAANLYLGGLDHFVKRELKIPGYLRYMDDFVLFAGSRAQLCEAQDAIAGWLRRERRLTLKRWPVHVHRTEEACEFLGWRLGAGGIQPGKKMRRRLRKNVRAAARRGPAALARTVAAYRALWEFGGGVAAV